MRITKLEIRNFRSIRHLIVDLNETTVFIGPNNSGKTAILDALRIALSRRSGQHRKRFSEYDIRLENESADPKSASGASIELRAEESDKDQWPDTVAEDLTEIIQLDPISGQRAIALRAEWAWNEDAGDYESDWSFLDAMNEPLVGRSARAENLRLLCSYMPIFYLGALRSAVDEYSSRSSQFWARLLKELEIPVDIEESVVQTLKELNARLLEADPRLTEIKETMSGAARVSGWNQDGSLGLQMAPLKVWDLLTKAEIILRNDPDSAWLPLLLQGQGVQSLSVIFLFQAFVNHLLRELFQPDSEPILALEEPEAHLYPQAVRSLWQHLRVLPGQKLITTHSPYFVQNVPFRDLRFVRLTDSGTEVRSLPASFSAKIPHVEALSSVVDNSSGLLRYDAKSQTLTVDGLLDEQTYQKLLVCYAGHADQEGLMNELRDLRDRSTHFVSDEELQSLETSARRMRGEIMFARRWLIVEGQSDYLIVHATASARGYNLDEHGVSVIDAQNNGSPAIFAVLARALAVPWVAVLDDDKSGRDYIKSIRKRGFSEEEISRRCQTHSEGDLEEALAAGGLRQELIELLSAIEANVSVDLSDRKLAELLGRHKLAYAAALATRLEEKPSLADHAPRAFLDAITKLKGLT